MEPNPKTMAPENATEINAMEEGQTPLQGQHHAPRPSSYEPCRRVLKRRHVNMIAISGMIGTGLFLASGQAIATAGPVGTLLGYIAMGMITWGVVTATSELSAFMPVAGGFSRHATKFVQPALGVAAGWNFWYTMATLIPAELSAAAAVIEFWDDRISPAVWYSVFLAILVVLNFCNVRFYGESAVFFAAIKIICVILLIIAGIVVDLGGSPVHDRIGFRYWREPGPFNTHLIGGAGGRFLGFWSTLIAASYSYGNIQVVAIAGSETINPRQVIPNALHMTFYRVCALYILSLFVVGLLVPYNDPNLVLSTGTADQSPFVIAFQRARIGALPSIVNAVVCTSAFSCASSCVFIASRTLYGLAEDRHAPRFLLATNRFGTPHFAVGASFAFSPLVYLSLSRNSSTVFGWFVNIVSIAGMINWIVIECTFLRFYYATRVQKIARHRLPYQSSGQPYVAWATLIALVVVILTSGYPVFFRGKWSTSTFLTCYIDIPIFLALWGVAWLFQKTNIFPLSEVDLGETDIIEREALASAGNGARVSWWRRWII